MPGDNESYREKKQQIDLFFNTQTAQESRCESPFRQERKDEQSDNAQQASPLTTLLDAIKDQGVLENIISTQPIDYLKWSVSFLLLSIAPTATAFWLEDSNSQSRLLFGVASATSLWHIGRNKYHGTPVIESVSDQAIKLISADVDNKLDTSS